MITANALNIKDNLVPAFCVGCGCRIGWTDTSFEDIPLSTYCEDCSRNDQDTNT